MHEDEFASEESEAENIMLKPSMRAISGDDSIPVAKADTFLKRLIGLMCRKKSDYGLLLNPCNSVHTFFMRYELDLLFLDESNRILKVMRNVKPRRITGAVRGAKTVLEYPSSLGAFRGIKIGMEIKFEAGK